MTRYLMVELEGGLDRSRGVGIWCALRQIPGVRSVTDMELISAETLETILLKPEPDAPLEVPIRVQQLEMLR